MKRLAFGALVMLALTLCAAVSRATVTCGSALAVPALAPSDAPSLWLAQRTITREWGPSDDSLYTEIDVKGYKSEGWAAILSGAMPGAGQLYAGEGSGWWYLVGEAAGWTGRAILRHRGDEKRNEAAGFVGDPYDSSSVWSFARFEQAEPTADVTYLQSLWRYDRDAFYQALISDPTLRGGFGGASAQSSFDHFSGLRDDAQKNFSESHWVEAVILAQHLYSAFDAFKAARFHNLPLRQELQLKVGGRFGHPDLRAALVRRF